MSIFLQTSHLSKTIKGEQIINDISLNVRKNSIYGLLGPNGAGKSTLLKIITGILMPSSGQILFDGNLYTRNNLKEIGSLIENPPLYENLSAYENLKIRAILLGLPLKRIYEVLKIVDLRNTGNKKTKYFSMGMKQRLGIALALLGTPRLLILDEPTNGLDPIGIQELRNLIRSFPQQGITVIFSSHILSEVELIADDIGILASGTLSYEGKITQDLNLEELFINIIHANTREV